MTGNVPVEVALDAHASTGESPVWSVAEQVLYWIDIQGCALHRFDPSGGEDRSWSVPDEIGCFALEASGSGAVCGLRSGVYALEFASERVKLLASPPYDPALFRFNEGACDATGRFWLGVMFSPRDPTIAGAHAKEPGRLHSFTREAGLVPHDVLALTPNGFGWDRTGRTMYFARTEARSISTYAFNPASGRLDEERLFAAIPEDVGRPDGAAVDAEGCYWSAIHDGGRLRRFTPDGKLDRDLPLPVSCPTMCAFGGADLDELYVTSASLGVSEANRSSQDGHLLRLRPGVHGRSSHAFGALAGFHRSEHRTNAGAGAAPPPV